MQPMWTSSPGPIDAALGKNERLELIGRDILDAVGIEARKIERPIRARIGHERNVVPQPRDKSDRASSRGWELVCLTTEN